MSRLDDNVVRYYSEQKMDPVAIERILEQTQEIRQQQAHQEQTIPENTAQGHPVQDKALAEQMPESGQALGEAELERIANHTTQNNKSQRIAFWPKRWQPALSAAAAVAVVTVIISFVVDLPGDGVPDTTATRTLNSPWPGQQIASSSPTTTEILDISKNNSDLRSLVLREAALNHHSKLEMDFTTNQLASLQASMSKLGFQLRLPSKVGLSANPESGFEIVGGRYCTIAGQLAAHLKFQSSDGRMVSLFMTDDDESLKVVDAGSLKFGEDLELSTFRERELFYVLASAI